MAAPAWDRRLADLSRGQKNLVKHSILAIFRVPKGSGLGPPLGVDFGALLGSLLGPFGDRLGASESKKSLEN